MEEHDGRRWNGRKRILEDKPCKECLTVFRPRWRGQLLCCFKCKLKNLHDSRRKAGTFFAVICWKEGEDRLLRELWPDPNNTKSLIAKKLKRTPRAVGNRANFLGLKRDERKAHLRRIRIMTGKGNPFFGKRHSEETKKTISEKISEVSAFHYKNKEPGFQRKRRRAWAATMGKKGPGRSERKLGTILRKASPGTFRFVGSGTFIVDGLNPDWVSKSKRKIVELFGRAFHDKDHCIWALPSRRTERGRRRVFRKHGYGLLVIWDDQLGDEKKLIRRVRRFANLRSFE